MRLLEVLWQRHIALVLSRTRGGEAECWAGVSAHISLERMSGSTNMNSPLTCGEPLLGPQFPFL